MQLLLDTQGIKLDVRNSSFEVSTDSDTRLISPRRVSGILVQAKITISSTAILLAAEHDIPVYFMGKYDKIKAASRKVGFNNASIIRRNQITFGRSEDCKTYISELFIKKIESQIDLLAFYKNRQPALHKILDEVIAAMHTSKGKIELLHNMSLSIAKESILGLEGSAARQYWTAVAQILPKEYMFGLRSQHPALDPFNAALNYGYGMLYTVVETAIYAAGMDPTLGIFHADQYQKPTLAFDLIEPFRPWIDRFVIESFKNQALCDSDFEISDQQVSVSKKGKQTIIRGFYELMNDRTTYQNQITTRKNHIYNEASELASFLFNLKI